MTACPPMTPRALVALLAQQSVVEQLSAHVGQQLLKVTSEPERAQLLRLKRALGQLKPPKVQA